MFRFRRSSWWYMASLQSCAWVAVFIYMWYQHTQDALPSMKQLELPCSFHDGTSLDKEANSTDADKWGSCCLNANICASTIFSSGGWSKQDCQKNICASVCMTATVEVNPSNPKKWAEPYQTSTIEVTPCNNARDAAELCENPATGLQPTNYLRLYTIMIVCSMLVIPGFQVWISFASNKEQKDERSEEEEQDSSDEYLEFLDED